MRPSSATGSRKAPDRTRARNATLINLCATPGLGSLLARRWISGAGQLALSIAGFAFVVVWFVKVMIQFYGQIQGDVAVKPVGWIGLTGAGVFAAAWVWSLVTSISILNEAKRNAASEAATAAPPLL